MRDGSEVAGEVTDEADLDELISRYNDYAECYSADYRRHSAHLEHLDLLVRAGRLDELAAMGRSDRHACHRLDRFLKDQGRADELERRAQDGDAHALYCLIPLLLSRGDQSGARRVVAELAPSDEYAAELLER